MSEQDSPKADLTKATDDAVAPEETSSTEAEKEPEEGSYAAIVVLGILALAVLVVMIVGLIVVLAYSESYDHAARRHNLMPGSLSVTLNANGDLNGYPANSLVIYTDQPKADGVVTAGLVLADGQVIPAVAIASDKLVISHGAAQGATAKIELSTDKEFIDVYTAADAVRQGTRKVVIDATPELAAAITNATR